MESQLSIILLAPQQRNLLVKAASAATARESKVYGGPIRLAHRDADDMSSEAFLREQIDGRRMSRVMEFINDNIDGELNLSSLASVACLSRSQFVRLFKKTTGQSPHEFVRNRRIQLAGSLLLDHGKTILDVAMSTGFSSQSNFARAFRAVTSMTPSEYRLSQEEYLSTNS